MSTQLYGGDIYLLGGSHYLKNGADNNGDSSASTATTAFGGSNLEFPRNSIAKGIGSSKRRRNTKKRRTNQSNKSRLMKATNSILEEDEDKKTDYGGDNYNSLQNDISNNEEEKVSPKKVDAVVAVKPSQKTKAQEKADRQRKHAVRDEYLRRPPNSLVTLIKSPFANREPFVFFPYAPFLKVQRPLPKDYSKIIQFYQD